MTQYDNAMMNPGMGTTLLDTNVSRQRSNQSPHHHQFKVEPVAPQAPVWDEMRYTKILGSKLAVIGRVERHIDRNGHAQEVHFFSLQTDDKDVAWTFPYTIQDRTSHEVALQIAQLWNARVDAKANPQPETNPQTPNVVPADNGKPVLPDLKTVLAKQ